MNTYQSIVLLSILVTGCANSLSAEFMGSADDYEGIITVDVINNTPKESIQHINIYTPSRFARNYKLSISDKSLRNVYERRITKKQYERIYASVSAGMSVLNLTNKSNSGGDQMGVSLDELGRSIRVQFPLNYTKQAGFSELVDAINKILPNKHDIILPQATQGSGDKSLKSPEDRKIEFLVSVDDYNGAILVEIPQTDPSGSTKNVIFYTPTSSAYDNYVIRTYHISESGKMIGDEYVKTISREKFKQIYASVSASMCILDLTNKSAPDSLNMSVALHVEVIPNIRVQFPVEYINEAGFPRLIDAINQMLPDERHVALPLAEQDSGDNATSSSDN